MRAEEVKGLMEAYQAVYAPQELTEEQVWEEVENWVNNLLEEGYDLSDYTWEEMYESYLTEVGGNPGAGIVAQQQRQRAAQASSTKKALQTGKSVGVSDDGGFLTPAMRTGSARLNSAATKSQGRTVLNYTGDTVRGPRGSTTTRASSNKITLGGQDLYKAQLGGKDVYVGAKTPGSATPPPAKPAAGTPPKPAASPAAAKPAASPAAAKPAASPAAAKPAGPATGMLGKTSFERRLPTSAELKAAQAARAGGEKDPEKVLQAAQKTNLPTTGPTPAIPDVKSIKSDLARANSPTNLNKSAPAGSALAAQQAKTSPVSKPVAPVPAAKPTPTPAATAPKKTPMQQRLNMSFDVFDVVLGHLLDEGYAETEQAAMVMMNNMSEEWRLSILESCGIEILDEAEVMKHQNQRNRIEKMKSAEADRVKRARSAHGKLPFYHPPTKGPHGEIERRQAQRPPSRLRSGSLPKKED